MSIKCGQFLREAFSEPDGKGSFGRLVTWWLFAAAIIWISYYVYRNKALPDALTLTGLGAFCMLPYGAGKTTNLLAEMKNPTPPTDPPKTV